MFLISLAKSLPRLASIDGLLVLGGRPLGVAGHGAPSTPRRQAAPRTMVGEQRVHPMVSGEFGVERGGQQRPRRTATILPPAAAGTEASTSTDGPTDSTQGARMNTARIGSAPSAGKSHVGLERVHLATERVAPHRPCRCRRSAPGRRGRRGSCLRAGSSRRTSRTWASRRARASRSGSIRPQRIASIEIVVDSPPGRTRPSTPVQRRGVRDRDRAHPDRLQGVQVLAHVPWSARTPMVRAGSPARARRGGAVPGSPRR